MQLIWTSMIVWSVVGEAFRCSSGWESCSLCKLLATQKYLCLRFVYIIIFGRCARKMDSSYRRINFVGVEYSCNDTGYSCFDGEAKVNKHLWPGSRKKVSVFPTKNKLSTSCVGENTWSHIRFQTVLNEACWRDNFLYCHWAKRNSQSLNSMKCSVKIFPSTSSDWLSNYRTKKCWVILAKLRNRKWKCGDENAK